MNASIIGWAHTPFAKHDGYELEELIGQVSTKAVDDAGLEPSQIDSIVVGHYNSGLSSQDFAAPLVLQAEPAFRFKPTVRVENACATGSAAIRAGLSQIAARDARAVLVIGVEKMTSLPNMEVGKALQNASYRREEGNVPGGFAGVFAAIADSYFAKWGDQSEIMAYIAAKNHRNGIANPYAHMRRDLGFEACNVVSDKNPIVAGPLRRTDCSMVSDGAAAIVLADTAYSTSARRAIGFRGLGHATDFMPMSRRDMTRFEGGEVAWRQALSAAGVVLSDLDLVETHDCFTIAELIEYETMGLVPHGEGRRAILEGWVTKEGRLPVNPSGGLKAKGHPIGATGVSMHIMAALQLSGEAGDMQIAGATMAGVFNMGGAAVANYASVLERIR
ncbi:thiolase domain-containing protein [Mesorhizobium sp. B2-4-13]|uniref:acetyl-CoA acetyltransferase n=1 Tax=Mesorhizobium sp. B2-4-13 TaxID=2589936 RepID=UPI0011538ACE|nr:acetyl-CoA acetyltransferase [Mesorhizobium sp. B2-4-13]TPK87020.1 thiolase domain-containing protein [Mesorhizobium sp. B2-4-13]